jgi:hypothetical protein
MKKSTRNTLMCAGGIAAAMHLINTLVSEPTPLNDILGLAAIAILVVCVLARVDASEPSDGKTDTH